MYCKKCGKFIYSDDDYCSDCAPKEAPVNTPAVDVSAPEPVVVAEPVAQPDYTPAEPTKPKREGRVMDGFGPAITGVILSIISFSLAYVAFLFLTMNGIMGMFDEDISGMALEIICIIYIIIALGMAIPSLIMGIKSIRLFRSAIANKRVKPIPAFILGIYGTIMSGLSILMVGAAFMMLVSSLLMKF